VNDGGERRIALAAIAGAHGVRGEVRLKLFSDSIANIAHYERLYVGGQPKRLLDVRQSGNAPIATFEGVSDRSGAEALRGSLVEVDRSALQPLQEGEYYHADLIGLPAVDRESQPIGTIVAVENYGAGDLLEIEDDAGRRLLIPFRSGIADLKDGRIMIDPEFLA
jgi:16S rRNA processing protein RimM